MSSEKTESLTNIMADIIPVDITFDSIWGALSDLIVSTPWHPYDLILIGLVLLAYNIFPLIYHRKRYQIVKADSVAELELIVDRLISRNWYPRGGVVVITEDKSQTEVKHVYMQTMFKL
ncbi:MAG: hypothetical protein OQL19_00860 [Gammaproteobacteria bacterium]|nr:hypothetical protein [Gammaproteobacteria bacterium]